ncbi:hypothetical protein [Auritidibacter ignavus]|uniref:hypothetical protein n=1 Tax=Auritidibacter ignavus TaxID=678932 RepID=UPI002446AB31|nr:hypothetical protein [Auritidibacter ignavus]WGH82960.1 hypothetical protein QDX20_06595 [Auritidibacter ignavus]
MSDTQSNSETKNFWLTGKGVLTIALIALGLTALVTFGVVRAVSPAAEGIGQEATYTDETTDSVCGLGGVAREGSIGSTPDAEWVNHRNIFFPVSEEYGPGHRDENGVPSCFEHSPRGMMFAAVSYTAMLTNPDQFDGAALATPIGPAADTDSDSSQIIDDVRERFSGEDSAVGGFRLVSYDGDSGVIEVAVTSFDGTNTTRASLLLAMEWVEGDWKIADDMDEQPVELRELEDHIGFQQFRA